VLHCELLDRVCINVCPYDLQASAPNPPDVWIQLLRHLLCDTECRKALLQRSNAAAAAPAELMLAQLAATLAEELAACLSG
jgi:hypothetical protein